MRLVILESPYAASDTRTIEENVAYARACAADCLRKGEAPMVSHLLYTQPGILRDEVPGERTLGIDAGLAWGKVADATVVYTDHGLSSGMRMGIMRARLAERPVEYRRLTP